MDVTLLGPQRRTSAARAAVAELMPDGPIAAVNAGWQEREQETAELADVLQGRMRNLELFTRWQRLLAADPELAEADRELSARLSRQQRLYALRLRHEVEAMEALRRRADGPESRDALEDALRVVRELDSWHLRAVQRHRVDFYTSTGIGERPSVQAERASVAELAGDCRGFVLAGGHVGVLLHVLHVFDARRLIRPPVIAWSAGAMACSDRVVLFHDFAASGRLEPQFWAEGLGLYPDVLPFPHARRRLDLADHGRLGLIARRFAPRTCLLLPDGERVDLITDHPIDPSARTLQPDTGPAASSIAPTAASEPNDHREFG